MRLLFFMHIFRSEEVIPQTSLDLCSLHVSLVRIVEQVCARKPTTGKGNRISWLDWTNQDILRPTPKACVHVKNGGCWLFAGIRGQREHLSCWQQEEESGGFAWEKTRGLPPPWNFSTNNGRKTWTRSPEAHPAARLNGCNLDRTDQ